MNQRADLDGCSNSLDCTSDLHIVACPSPARALNADPHMEGPMPSYHVRCDLLLGRGLSARLVKDLKAAENPGILAELEAMTDDQIAALTEAAKAVDRVLECSTAPRCPYPLTAEGRCSHHLDNVCQTATPHRPRRIRLSRAPGWRKPNGAVVVSRPSKWGNPWPVGGLISLEWPDRASGDGTQHARELEITPELAVALYRIAFTPDAEEIRAELAGHDLACWCPLNQPCHADVLLEIANQEEPPA